MRRKEIYLTDTDQRRLRGLLASKGNLEGREERNLSDLLNELERAEVVPAAEIPQDVVTMNTRIRLRDIDTGLVAEYTLVFPGEADISKGYLSVLAPIGTALLGYRELDTVEWNVPAGLKRFRVEEVLYQPEAEAARLV